MIEEMTLGHYAVIWIANGVIPLGLTMLFFVDQLIQKIIGPSKYGKKR